VPLGLAQPKADNWSKWLAVGWPVFDLVDNALDQQTVF